MEFKGSASLHNNDINVLRNVYGGMDMRIERVTASIGRVYLVDQGGNKQQLPVDAQGQLVVTVVDNTNTQIPPHNDEFLFMFADSFIVSVNGVMLMRLDQQRQHAIRAPQTLVHEILEA
ncbi:hypothetical protein CHLRE_10g427400v5 [Chlamydomonas reinhardtii]|uniref:Uncharacterized protein n=1 Tax=Chlamydomonas reinhardtii TaxID=3055 RepID=A0A2K3D9L3_CHLRE|nr:uncharacterized protein CHLRE_10g427400v5 [Chlamydomonas reinhardtii]PNW77222.1 hypothetical protein CHLRE_10g427400v5 [Chlamydomonas reinhardtii]